MWSEHPSKEQRVSLTRFAVCCRRNDHLLLSPRPRDEILDRQPATQVQHASILFWFPSLVSHNGSSKIMSQTSGEARDVKASREGSMSDEVKSQPPIQQQQPPQGPPPAPSYPTGVNLGVILFALFISLFCVALDSTIIATAIPRITDQFHALRDVGWYGSSYLLTKCGKSGNRPGVCTMACAPVC